MDIAISKWISNNMHGNDFFNKLMFFITEFGVGYIFWLILIISLIIYNLIKYKKLSFKCVSFLIFLLLAHLIGECFLKNIVKRIRPYHEIHEFEEFMKLYKYPLPSSYSFPSGHTFCAFTVAIAVSCFYKKMWWFLLPFAIIVGFSRIFVGAHYFLDVLAGAIFGAILGIINYYVVLYLNKKRKNYKYICD